MNSPDHKPVPVDERAVLRAVGVAIREGRRRLGLTQEQLSVRLDTTAEWISQLERGVGTPSIATLVRLAAALDVSPGDLLDVAVASQRGPVIGSLVGEAQQLPVEAVEALVELAKSMRGLVRLGAKNG